MNNAQNISHVQREMIEEVVEVLYQQETDFVSRLERKPPKETNFRGRRVPIETGQNPSLGFNSPAAGNLPTPGHPTLNHFTVPYVTMQMGLDTDYEAILNSSAGLITPALKNAVESTGRQMAKWLNIFASAGDGTARIATASAAYDATNATTQRTFITNGASDGTGSVNVIDGMKLRVFDPTGTVQRVGGVGAGSLTVESHTGTQTVFTTALPTTYIVGDILVPEGVAPSSCFSGIPKMIANSGSIHGISRSAVPTTQSTIVNGAAGQSAGLLMQTYLLIKQRTGKSAAKGKGRIKLYTGITQKQGYYSLTTATAQLLFPRDGNKRPGIDIGGDDVDEFTWFGLEIEEMRDWLANRIDFLNEKYLEIALLKKAGQMLAPFDKPLPGFDGATSNYKMSELRFFDVAEEFYSPAYHRHGALVSLPIAGLAQPKNLG